MAGYVVEIEEKTLKNANFREVLFTGPHAQLVVMTLGPNEEIGMESHDGIDQFVRIEAGQGLAILDGKEHSLKDGTAVVIPARTKHNIINNSRTEPLKLYSVYTSPEHPDGVIHKTKAEADADEREHHGKH